MRRSLTIPSNPRKCIEKHPQYELKYVGRLKGKQERARGRAVNAPPSPHTMTCSFHTWSQLRIAQTLCEGAGRVKTA